MGFFSLKATCSVCELEIGMNRFQISEKRWICKNCFKEAGYTLQTSFQQLTPIDVKNAIARKKNDKDLLSQFVTTKKIGTFLEFDDQQKKWLIPDGFLGKKINPKIYSYSDIVSFELLEDGSTVSKGGLGMALAGGLLFGGVGAIVGGVTGKKKAKNICESLRLKITVRDKVNPVIYIDLIKAKIKTNSFTYKTMYDVAQQSLSMFQIICEEQETDTINTQSTIADEIKKYKELLDVGAITQEEFEQQKKKLLSL